MSSLTGPRIPHEVDFRGRARPGRCQQGVGGDAGIFALTCRQCPFLSSTRLETRRSRSKGSEPRCSWGERKRRSWSTSGLYPWQRQEANDSSNNGQEVENQNPKQRCPTRSSIVPPSNDGATVLLTARSSKNDTYASTSATGEKLRDGRLGRK